MGIIEGFFGPQWSLKARESFPSFLAKHGGTFYIYAPKQDSQLRRKWREEWDKSYLSELIHLKKIFIEFGIKFGVGLSPFGLGTELSYEDEKLLTQKMAVLSDIGIDILGLFFDDMPTSDQLADVQMKSLSVIRRSFSGKIIFCPSYYSPDPILDKVFGPRPQDYLQVIGEKIPGDVSIAWTGPKVISPELPLDHLLESGTILKRRPFIWENIFANDGPKNCKYLKLKYFTGRSEEILPSIEAMGFNLMNQPELSKILFLSSKLVLIDGLSPIEAFDRALTLLSSQEFKKFILFHRELLCIQGLDQIGEDLRKSLVLELKTFKDPAAQEVVDWLEEKYVVGSDCLTD